MEYFVAMLLASFLDPVRVGIVALIVWLWRSPWGVVAAIVVSAVAVESLLTAVQFTRVWGEGIVPGVLVSVIQAGLICWLWRWRPNRAT
jgi:hypothetical protein